MKVFIEEQRFDQWWFRLLMLFASSIMLLATAKAYPSLKGNVAAFWVTISATVITTFVIFFILFVLKLETKIDEQGIHYGFTPIHFKLKLAAWKDMEHCSLIKYRPLADYGGWGYRMNLFRKKGAAYNIKGNIGIQIVFKDGKKLLIGTQKMADAENVLRTYSKKISPYEN
jgi:hypothetical protein